MGQISVKKWALLVAAALIVLRLPVFLQPVLDVDESIYGLFSRIWFDGGIPYIDCVETKPLGIYFFFGLIFSIFGRFNVHAVHAVTILVVGLTAYVIGLISERLNNSSKSAGLWAAFLYVVFGTTYIPKYIATTIEPIMLLPVVLQFFYWIKFEQGCGRRFALLAGLAFSAACLFKYQAGINLTVLMLYLGVVRPLVIRDVKYFQHWRGFSLFIIGAIPLSLIMIVYLAKVGGLDAFWLWNVKGSLDYIGEGSAILNVWKQLLTRVLPYIASTILLWVLAVFGCYGVVLKSLVSRVSRLVSSLGLLIVLWFILNIIPVSAGLRFYGHYFLLLLPPMCILAAPVILKAWGGKWKQRLIIFWILLPAVGFTVARFYTPKIHNAAGEDNLAKYKPVASYVSLKTEPSDRIVAWGYAPLVYWYSERLPATRFFWSDLLTGRVPGTRGLASDKPVSENSMAWDMFMSDVEKNRPIYIIDTAPSGLHDYQNFPVSKYTRLFDYVEQNYHEEVRINGSILYKRN